MRCDRCKDNHCYLKGKDCLEILGGGKEIYSQEDIEIMKAAASTEADYYMKATRLEEIRYFSQKMGFERLGVAFCIGFSREADLLCRFLEKTFTVYSVCCKVGGLDKDELFLQKMRKGEHESTCNPRLQAQVLNEKKTQLNLILGLCIGHDLLFTKHCQGYVSTFVVKDRVLGHNPIGALYSGYYQRKFNLK